MAYYPKVALDDGGGVTNGRPLLGSTSFANPCITYYTSSQLQLHRLDWHLRKL
jgi:hypothetical protein